MISTSRKIRRYGWEISLSSDLKDHVHSNRDVKQEVTMEEPKSKDEENLIKLTKH